MKKSSFPMIFFAFFFAIPAGAETRALFHPYDPTLKEIAFQLDHARRSIDIAMYNIDVRSANPVIKKIQSTEMQKRIRSGRLQIRMIFEGYESRGKVSEKMSFLESLGIDVRELASSKKMHHKFAVLDSGTNEARLITGSANWSLNSRRSYNENILFIRDQQAVIEAFQQQFEFLWGISREFGFSKSYVLRRERGVSSSPGMNVYFNTENFVVKNGRLSKKRDGKGYALTRRIVKAISSAKSRVQIATTRIKLRPVYEAILAAARRGVKVDIVVSMGEYQSKGRRKSRPPVCSDPYQRQCSSGKNFSSLLVGKDGKPNRNIRLRVKYFNLDRQAYLNKQMHSKYLIVDGETLLTGSFNWSYSAEYNHIENLVEVKKSRHLLLVESFEDDFSRLWSLGRSSFPRLLSKVRKALINSEKIKCGFAPKSLSFKQIDQLLALGKEFGKKTTEVCR